MDSLSIYWSRLFLDAHFEPFAYLEVQSPTYLVGLAPVGIRQPLEFQHYDSGVEFARQLP